MALLRAAALCALSSTVGAELLIQKEAPDFTLQAAMPDDSVKDITLSSYQGKYVILFFYQSDFGFVCGTEILAFNEMVAELAKKDTVVLGVSTDSVHSHLAYRRAAPKEGGIGMIDFPLVADFQKQAAEAYGVLAEDGSAHRGLFLVDKTGIVRHQLVSGESLGRSVDSAIRVLDAVQFNDKKERVCPANFKADKARDDDSLAPASAPLGKRYENVAAFLGKRYRNNKVRRKQY